MEIVTGYKGEAHITAWQDRDVNQGAFGNGNYILGVGSKMAATVVNSNTIRIADGALCMNGCVAVIQKGTYDSVAIDSGSQGMLRRDLIVARYTRNASTGVENIALAVIKGTPTSGTPTTPSYTEGDIQAGDSLAEFPLYRVNLSGINVSTTRMADILLTGEEILEANDLLNALDTQFDVWSNRLTAVETKADNNATAIANMIKKKEYTYTYSLAANTNLFVTGDMLGFSSLPSGWAPISAQILWSGSNNVAVIGFKMNSSGNASVVELRNLGSTAVSNATLRVGIVYVRVASYSLLD